MRAHLCPDCNPRVGHFLRRLQWETAQGHATFDIFAETVPRVRQIMESWERRDVPKVFRA